MTQHNFYRCDNPETYQSDGSSFLSQLHTGKGKSGPLRLILVLCGGRIKPHLTWTTTSFPESWFFLGNGDFFLDNLIFEREFSLYWQRFLVLVKPLKLIIVTKLLVKKLIYIKNSKLKQWLGSHRLERDYEVSPGNLQKPSFIFKFSL